MVCTEILIYFGRPWLGHTIKINSKAFQTVDQDTCSNLIFIKESGTIAFASHFEHDFSRKIVLMLYSIN